MRRRIWIATIVMSVAILAVCSMLDVRSILAAYLVAWVALASIPIGALGLLLTSYLVRRDWTTALHGVMVAATDLLPVAGLLFIPVLLGMSELYPAAADRTSMPPFRSIYLAPWFFSLRSVLYFCLWYLIAIWARRAWENPDKMARAASVGLIVFSLTVSLAGIDWIESLEPDFHSSIYGLLFIAFVLLGALAFVVVVTIRLDRPIAGIGGYSALLLSMILLWAYFHAMQYIVIWSANIPDEVIWYIERSSKGWQWLLIVLAVGQFVVPFFALLARGVRRSERWLFRLCALTLVMRGCESALLILPPLHATPLLAWIGSLAALAALSGILWLSFSAALGRREPNVNVSLKSVRAREGS